ncbi:hypothetical protein X975_04561, partial [Stegodyphus mimosarum]
MTHFWNCADLAFVNATVFALRVFYLQSPVIGIL